MKEIENLIQQQKQTENKLANLVAQDLEYAFEYVLSELGRMISKKDRTIVRNNLAKELEVLYNELVELYPEYSDELSDLIPSNFDEKLVTKDRYIRIVSTIAMLVFIKSFLEHMFGEFEDDTFHLYKDNPVLGQRLIDRLLKNVTHIIYVIIAWSNNLLAKGKLDDGAFKVSKAHVSWFKSIITDYYTYYTRYKSLWDMSTRGVKTYTFYTSEDELVCSECGPNHENTYDVSKAIVGVNFPPIHNRCRCWIVEEQVGS